MIFKNINHTDLPEIANKIASKLNKHDDPPFVVYLLGEMGSGKTTITRHILYSLGLSREEYVCSPTFVLMNEYNIGGSWYGHCDFYRTDLNLNLKDLGIFDARNYKGIFIEWPHNSIPQGDFNATHKLTIHFCGNNNRDFALDVF